MINEIYEKVRMDGVRGLLNAVFHRFFPQRLAYYPNCKTSLQGRFGLEIGGPSHIFGSQGLIPAYTIAACIDNCTFSHQTIWEGEISEGNTFHFNKKKSPGKQYIVEASNLERIESARYDFVISSHVLEHVANPLRALSEWVRILKEDGTFILVLPHKDGTFDHRRPVTSLEHLIQDFEQQTGEGDTTHMKEIFELHDLSRDPDAGDMDSFKKRSIKNMENRCLHQHVFDTGLAIEVVNHMGLQILSVELFKPFHIVIVAQKLKSEVHAMNDEFIGRGTLPRWTSPFPSDQPSRHQIQATA
ncbi:class I SAM-dependent methyltransferase [Polaromonas sp. SP1]|uniref:methyltransferase domain-containing protein n=1 Tax=Polaromonas sp. SP1 TaxID=2268087 RepID=UPI0013DDA2D2|nr:class I SAM-dependent methyltransferase [Polaromonas sp. SP1]